MAQMFSSEINLGSVRDLDNSSSFVRQERIVNEELKAATGEGNVEVSWPEGVAFINFENTPNFTEEDFKNVIEKAGFEVGKVATLDEKIIDPKTGLISLNNF